MTFAGNWNEEKYQELLEYLHNQQDLKYKEFHSKIIQYDNLIGVRTDILKKTAKEISLGNYQDFLKLNDLKLHETISIEGFLYGYLKISLEDLTSYLDNYLPHLKSWAHVDCMVSNLKIFKKKENQELGFKYAKKLIRSKNNWLKRTGIIILLNYYLHDIYIDKTLELISKLKVNDYYVKMAIAWLMSVAYIKYKEKTLVYLINIQDDFIYSKSLSKIVDSRQISKQEKEFIKSLRRKKED